MSAKGKGTTGPAGNKKGLKQGTREVKSPQALKTQDKGEEHNLTPEIKGKRDAEVKKERVIRVQKRAEKEGKQ